MELSKNDTINANKFASIGQTNLSIAYFWRCHEREDGSTVNSCEHSVFIGDRTIFKITIRNLNGQKYSSRLPREDRRPNFDL